MSKSIQSWRTLYNLINSLTPPPLSSSSSTHDKARRHSAHDHAKNGPTSYRSTSRRRYMYYANIPSRRCDDDDNDDNPNHNDDNLSIYSLTLSSSSSSSSSSSKSKSSLSKSPSADFDHDLSASHFSRASLSSSSSSSSSGRTRLYTRTRRDVNQQYNNNRNNTSCGCTTGKDDGRREGGGSGAQGCHHHHHHHQRCAQSSAEEQQQQLGPVQKNNSYMTTSSCTHSHSHSHSHSTWSLLNSHAKTRHTCQVCQLGLPSEKALQTHIEHYNHHCQGQSLHPSQPHRQSQQPQPQQPRHRHKRRPPPPRNPKIYFRCYTCEACFNTRAQLIAHLEHYHATKFMCCPHCESIFSKASHLETHVRKAHSHLHCYRCRTVAPDEETLVEHYNDYHLKCKYCFQRFPFLWVHQQKCPARKLQ